MRWQGRHARGRTKPFARVALVVMLLAITGCATVTAKSPTRRNASASPTASPKATATSQATATPSSTATTPAGDPPANIAQQSRQASMVARGPDGWMWRAGIPNDRLMVYYYIPYAPWGFMGTYPDDPNGDAELLARINQQSSAYQQLDPSHPVVNAIDIVSPVVEADPGPDGYYAGFAPDDLVQHYYDLATSHHMLFFLDIQLGRMPVQVALSSLAKWISLPNVEVALDPEFDVAPNGIPDVNLGIMHASEINTAVQTISNIVTTQQLPHKVLIVHQWAEPSLPDWYNVKTDPNISIVTCSDGFGTPDEKVQGDYATFDGKQLIQYPGFKLFYPNWPGQRGDHPNLDIPLMSPQDVLNLTPQPMLIMYQ